jgi:hypothetical protein
MLLIIFAKKNNFFNKNLAKQYLLPNMFYIAAIKSHNQIQFFMARNILPEDFASQQSLATKVNNQHEADDTNSVLSPYLTQNNIDLSKVVSVGITAATHEVSRKLLTGSSETQRKLRDNIFTPVFADFQSFVQFLKRLYKSNTKELTAWSITIDTNGKITYPASFEDRAKLVETFLKKHNDYANNSSPLQPYITANKVEIENISTNLAKATTAHAAFENDAQKATLETRLRDEIWTPAFKKIKDIAGYLLSLYKSNPKKVTAWGFDIVDASAATGLRTSTVKAAETITSSGIVIGGTFTNIGTSDLHVYKGKTTKGNPSIVHANEQLGMVKGYSVITVVNPSTLVSGKFTVLVNK